jgi:uncharacterized membrane protein
MFENTVISPESTWLLWAILFTAAAFGLWAEKTKWGSKLSAVVITILFGFILSNLAIIPTDAAPYDVVWSYLVPLAIPLLLFKADMRRIIKEAGPTLFAFMFGAIGTILGTIIAYNMLYLGEEGWKMAGIFCATYIGGSMNFVAASEALQLLSSDLIAAGIAADNLVMTLYFLLLFALPSVAFLRKIFPTKHEDKAQTISETPSKIKEKGSGLNIFNMSAALAIALSVSALGFLLQDLVQLRGTAILFITALIVLIATLFPRQMEKFSAADQIGALLMQVFFAVIGASANIMIVLQFGPILFLFAAVILFIHLIFILSAGKLFKLDLSEIVIASNANMGGPTTAAAMAVARRWDDLVIPAVLCGTLGYAVATFLGVAVGYWLR